MVYHSFEQYLIYIVKYQIGEKLILFVDCESTITLQNALMYFYTGLLAGGVYIRVKVFLPPPLGISQGN